jgi:hypothetical protein
MLLDFLSKTRSYKINGKFGRFSHFDFEIRKEKNTQKYKMEIDEYWKQFAQVNKITTLISSGLYFLSELFGIAFVLANAAVLFRYKE